MQRTVQVIVALLNIVWVVFFLHPDPFSLSVQRRSSEGSDEEMVFGEFCIQPESDMNWTSTLHPANITTNKTNNTNTTTEAKSNFTLHEVQQDCHCNKTNMQQRDLLSSQLLRVEFKPPAPGCEPQIIMTFPNVEVCIDKETYLTAIAPLVSDLDEKTPATTPSSEVTAASGLISHNSLPAAPVVKRSCCIKVSSQKIPFDSIKGYMLQRVSGQCPITATIFQTDRQLFCVNLRAPWVRQYIKDFHNKTSTKSKIQGTNATRIEE
ncbi:uncharacterized protein LOC127349512 isoform X2 [Dicentrarchus labrax]|uniref:uncharacterized protein LOC127349512 isoform X2 n=1 Tax=Dicentrarchus labrax TaxID=13489 RepID=UPI0021F5777E|nr:uncharacterized protein LOC127349512 isoform X2 [Dicentrarchus labrax]